VRKVRRRDDRRRLAAGERNEGLPDCLDFLGNVRLVGKEGGGSPAPASITEVLAHAALGAKLSIVP
jgi:hypothetical protein